MSNTFDYLRKFLPPHPEYEGTNRNWFYPIPLEEIPAAEEKLGFKIPDQLRNFYQEIGYGSLYAPHDAEKGYRAIMSNHIFSPLAVAAFYKPLEGRDWNEYDGPIEAEGYYMAADSYGMLEPGDLPFFEIGDSSAFLVLRPHSDNPNAVWSDTGIKIEDSFDKFIWRLYYEDPAYYGEVIKAHYENQESNAND